MKESWQATLDLVDTALWDPALSGRLFYQLSHQKKGGGIEALFAEPYAELSDAIDESGIQDSSVARICLLVRTLVKHLIDEEGAFRLDQIERAIEALRSQLYPLGPSRYRDALFRLHLLRCLVRLKKPAIQRLVRRAVSPVDNRQADYLIRATLQISRKKPMTPALARQAVLCAWMTPLRQSVGSCFATAPAIVIQSEQPERFLDDLVQLLSKGRLTRIVGEGEWSIPLGKSWGLGELRRPIPADWIPDRVAHSPALQAALLSAGLLDRGAPLYPQARQLLGEIEHEVTDCDGLLCALIRGPERLEEARDQFKAVADCALLKAWEFSLASFTDLRADINRWNLYHALGIRHDVAGGIGAVVHDAIQEQIEGVNRDLELMDESFDRAESSFKVAKTRLKGASTGEERQWMRADTDRRLHEVELIGEERHLSEIRGQRLAHLFVALMNRYLELLRDSFQEAYDAEMQDVQAGPFDDSPAGFRLVYKHGRANPALWTWIRGPKEFVDALVDFFVTTESQLLPEEEWQPVRNDLSLIVSRIITHLRSPDFVEGTLRRMAELYKTQLIDHPMENLDKVAVKPWAYVSGGAMEGLLHHYYGREEEITLKGRWVDSPLDLFVMLLDLFKEIPSRFTDPLVRDPTGSLLMQSPTHAFIAKPGLPPFSSGWSDRGNSYTWARDQIVVPQKRFLDAIKLGREERRWFVQRLLPGASIELSTTSVASFRNALLDRVGDKFSEQLDSLLYSALPLHPLAQVEERVIQIFSRLMKAEQAAEISGLVREMRPSQTAAGYLSALELQRLCHAVWMVYTGSPTAPRDLAFFLRRVMRQLGFAYPSPALFADSNWTHNSFAFLVHPGTGELDLWRVDYLGIEGAPMGAWREWLDGSSREPWSVYTDPRQYGLH